MPPATTGGSVTRNYIVATDSGIITGTGTAVINNNIIEDAVVGISLTDGTDHQVFNNTIDG